ncbi:MAG: hypothetical protein IT381_32760 [Deltaproteobacteria bacterium]|nr:hypothetical protein [Deltaproteobacteria bacterium]
MMEASSRLDDSLLSLAWSLWAELGVSSVVQAHAECYVDPEALLIFTASLADVDPRLRDESLDCALTLAPFLWTSRLKTLLLNADEQQQRAFGSYAATFNGASTTHVTLPLADAERAPPLRRSGKSRSAERPEAPSQLAIRCRAIFGVGARADALAVMLCSPNQGWLAAELALHVGLPKRAMATVLQDFARGGLMRATAVGNRLRYDLVQRKGLELIVGVRPRWKPAWALILPCLIRMRAIVARTQGKETMTALIESQKAIVAFLDDMAALGLHGRAPDYRSWSAVVDWTESIASGLAGARSEWFGADIRSAA